MNTLISICIPTYRRPDLLQQAVESCLAQTYQDFEIIISDDSKDDLTEQKIQSFTTQKTIRYYRNRPSLGQANNVNRLFDLAQGDRLILLHDDDLLLPDALERLSKSWELEPKLTACFGKQYLINLQGDILETSSQELNRSYCRTTKYAGLQTSALWSALVGQFPNDGYMVLTKAAQSVRYRDTPDVGDSCDYDFGLRLATQYENFYFVDKFTAKYRLTPESNSRNNNHANLTYGLIESLALPQELETTRMEKLHQFACPAVTRWLSVGNKSKAFKIFTSKYYSLSKKITLKGIAHAILLLCPNATLHLIFQNYSIKQEHKRPSNRYQ
jgi:glycosyltransferase involved in cell wall biosynthesis